MDLQIAVAASLLPASRSKVAACFKLHRERSGDDPLHAALTQSGLAAEAAADAVLAALVAADRLIIAGATAGIEPIPWFDLRFPALLDCIPDPPPVLWLRGDAAVLARPIVAVVGSRAATEYARQVGERLGFELGAHGIVVASGLARGVDSAAHQGCLNAAGATIAVLGSGVDRIYPAEHTELATAIAAHGAVVSELGPGAPPLPEHFPLRNRIISGLSLAVVVVEASERSGSLITARCALEQGRDVMAVPGSVLSGRNRGSHSLLKDGAKVIESAEDILEELGWLSAQPVGESVSATSDADPVLGRMECGEPYRLDELMAITGIAGPRLLPRLMELELQGRVITGAGGTFSRVAHSLTGGDRSANVGQRRPGLRAVPAPSKTDV